MAAAAAVTGSLLFTDGSSQDELSAVNQLKGQDRAPDVLDMGTAFAVKGAQQGIAVSLPAQPVLVATRRVS